MSKQWFAPEEKIAHDKMAEREKMRASANLDRSATPDQSVSQAIDEKWYPMAPEHWKK